MIACGGTVAAVSEDTDYECFACLGAAVIQSLATDIETSTNVNVCVREG